LFPLCIHCAEDCNGSHNDESRLTGADNCALKNLRESACAVAERADDDSRGHRALYAVRSADLQSAAFPSARAAPGSALRPSDSCALEPESEQAQVESRPSATDQIRDDLANRAGKLKPVSGARTGDEYLRAERMWSDQKVMVRRVRVQTNGGID